MSRIRLGCEIVRFLRLVGEEYLLLEKEDCSVQERALEHQSALVQDLWEKSSC